MLIAIIGHGRMGKAIGDLAIARGHSLVVIGRNDDVRSVLTATAPQVAIEFTSPGSAPRNLMACLDLGIPVVCGTTGWLEHRPEIEVRCKEKGSTMFYASNFSLGVNLFFRLNEQLARLMEGRYQYRPAIHEIHHTGKKDSPSGTAITLAEGILSHRSDLSGWSTDDQAAGTLPVTSERIDPYPGHHVVSWTSRIDDIQIIHHAHSREGFAAGALAVAEWLPGRKGILGMDDFLPL